MENYSVSHSVGVNVNSIGTQNCYGNNERSYNGSVMEPKGNCHVTYNG